MERNLEKIEESCFLLEPLTPKDREIHFHKCLEIYCVVKGKAFFRISGDNRLLTQGQMAIVNPFENHSCETVGDAEVLRVRIGTDYLGVFSDTYPDKQLPRWLTDEQINNVVRDYIDAGFPQGQDSTSVLSKNGIACQLMSTVIEGYGLAEQENLSLRDQVLIAEIVQYIYDHCSEGITLESLSGVFYLYPSILSKKLRKRICVDFRVFVNDIRVHKAVQMMDDPENREKRIEDIAHFCGFNSMSTFYRCYKRNYGFRRMRAAEENMEL